MSARWTKILVTVTLIVCFLGMEAQMLPYPYGAPSLRFVSKNMQRLPRARGAGIT